MQTARGQLPNHRVTAEVYSSLSASSGAIRAARCADTDIAKTMIPTSSIDMTI